MGKWRSRSISITTPRRRPIRESWRKCDDTNSSILEMRAASILTAERHALLSKRLGDRSQICWAPRPEEIVFTSGATESNNLVLLGLASYGRRIGRTHILASSIEHTSVLGPLEVLGREGFDIELLPIGLDGYVDPTEVRARLRSITLLVSIMHANNETGVLQPVLRIAPMVADSKCVFPCRRRTDIRQGGSGAQGVGVRPSFDQRAQDPGPQGSWCVFVKRTGKKRGMLAPIIHGGGQEAGLRPGTLPVPLIIGLGLAAELALREHVERARKALAIRREFERHLAGVDHVVNGDVNRMQSHVLNVSFPGVDSEALMLAIRDSMAISNGAACSSASYRQSHVLAAMGFGPDRISSSVRFSWGPGVDSIPFDRLVDAIRSLSGPTV